MVRSGAKWKACPEIEVVHVHGFRPHEDANRLLEDYEYGNGGVYGRALRRGDLASGGRFLFRELIWTINGAVGGRRADQQHGGRALRLRGFWHGFRLPPRRGFVSASELQQRISRFTSPIRSSFWTLVLSMPFEAAICSIPL
jgi:hypothetical protein